MAKQDTKKKTFPKRIEFKEEFIELSEGLFRAGWNKTKVAKALGVSVKTFERWEKKYPELRAAYLVGKDFFVSEVCEKSMAMLCQPHKKVIKKYGRDEQGNKVLLEETESQILPNLGAIKYYLNNRRPGRWKEKHEVLITDTGYAEAFLAAKKEREEKDESNINSDRTERQGSD